MSLKFFKSGFVGLYVLVGLLSIIIFFLVTISTNKSVPSVINDIHNNKTIKKSETKNWILKMNTDNGLLTLYNNRGYTTPKIARWNNFLFYAGSIEDRRAKIYMLNLNNGAQSVLYEDIGDNDNYISVTDVQVIDDTLYFSTGGYLVKGATYWIDLPIKSTPIKPNKLTDSRNASIRFMNNRYWIIGGEGDACWGQQDYYLLDTELKNLVSVAESFTGCNDGLEFIGIDKDERFIMADHSGFEFGRVDKGAYNYLLAIPLQNINNKQVVLSKTSTPKNIRDINFSEVDNSVVLLGDALYIFDLTKDELIKIIEIPENWIEVRLSSVSANIVCLSQSGIGDLIEINLATKKIVDTKSEKCQHIYSENWDKDGRDIERRTREIIKSLDLPEGYSFNYE